MVLGRVYDTNIKRPAARLLAIFGHHHNIMLMSEYGQRIS
jgi:hypothetical protein